MSCVIVTCGRRTERFTEPHRLDPLGMICAQTTHIHAGFNHFCIVYGLPKQIDLSPFVKCELYSRVQFPSGRYQPKVAEGDKLLVHDYPEKVLEILHGFNYEVLTCVSCNQENKEIIWTLMRKVQTTFGGTLQIA